MGATFLSSVHLTFADTWPKCGLERTFQPIVWHFICAIQQLHWFIIVEETWGPTLLRPNSEKIAIRITWLLITWKMETVSYTHLDVYKRQYLSFVTTTVNSNLRNHYGNLFISTLPNCSQVTFKSNRFVNKNFLRNFSLVDKWFLKLIIKRT